MPEAVEWGADGTPRSARFDDIYRSASGGLAQARHVFLQGCGLPAAWAGQRQWRILETGFGLGTNFLAAWQAWKDDPNRPAMLHYASIEAWPVAADDIRRSARLHPELEPLAGELSSQWWGLLPGFHRISFEGGRVLLTLCVGDVQEMLKQQSFQADSVFLDGFDPAKNPRMWDLPVLKGVARLARRGAGIATWTVSAQVRHGLEQCGFRVRKADGLPPKRHCLEGVYDPLWEPKGASPAAPAQTGRCVVIGAGLAGAAAAASLARRGWRVTVLDAADRPAAGASGLPAGLLAPHQSPDDNPLSRLSRAGVRCTLQAAEALLLRGDAWEPSGVLEHRVDDARWPPDLGDALAPWTRGASAAEKARAGLPAAAHAWWHEKAGWIRPALLVRALLGQSSIETGFASPVRQLVPVGGDWRVIGDAGREMVRCELVVVAAAYDSAALLPNRLALNPVRGQVSWSHDLAGGIPTRCPVNGNGHFLPGVPLEGGHAWLSGSTYGRGETARDERPQDHVANLERLQSLLPATAAALAPRFAARAVNAWTGVRCVSTDRRPLVGRIAEGLWVTTAMGSRGLTFCLLCAELLAARLHGEPLPLERKLAEAMGVERQPECQLNSGG